MDKQPPKRKKRSRKDLTPEQHKEMKKDVYRLLQSEKRRKTRTRIKEELISNCGWKEEHFWESGNLGKILDELLKEGHATAFDDKWDSGQIFYWRSTPEKHV